MLTLTQQLTLRAENKNTSLEHAYIMQNFYANLDSRINTHDWNLKYFI